MPAIDVLYFAWIKEKIGVGQEQVSPPGTVKTVSDLLDWLADRSAGHRSALSDRARIRAALDQTHVPLDSPIEGAGEIAFFPPVTGGAS